MRRNTVILIIESLAKWNQECRRPHKASISRWERKEPQETRVRNRNSLVSWPHNDVCVCIYFGIQKAYERKDVGSSNLPWNSFTAECKSQQRKKGHESKWLCAAYTRNIILNTKWFYDDVWNGVYVHIFSLEWFRSSSSSSYFLLYICFAHHLHILMYVLLLGISCECILWLCNQSCNDEKGHTSASVSGHRQLNQCC